MGFEEGMKWVLKGGGEVGVEGGIKWVLKDGEMGVEGGEMGFKRGSSGC